MYKKKVIHYKEKYYCIVGNLLLNGLFISLEIFMINQGVLYERIAFVFWFSLFLSIFLIFLLIMQINYNIVFDYRKKEIRYLYPGTYKIKKIAMTDIKKINFTRANSTRLLNNNPLDVEGLNANGFYPFFVYNHGEKYLFTIILYEKEKEVIEYNSLYKCKRINKIEKFEREVNKIIEECNNYIFQNSMQLIKKLKQNEK